MIWTPSDPLDLLMVSLPLDTGETEIKAAQQINLAGQAWLQGRLDTGTYMDTLEEFGLDPLDFVGEVEDYTDRLIRCLT